MLPGGPSPTAHSAASALEGRVPGTHPVTAFIGVGTMMETLIAGAAASGWPRGRLLATHRCADRRAELAARFGIATDADNAAAVRIAGVVVLGVRPQQMAALLQDLAPAFRPGQVLLSIAAGLTLDWLAARLPPGMAVLRVTPPPTVAVAAGVALLSAGAGVTPEQRALAEALLAGTCERMEWIPDALMEPVTGAAQGLTPYVCALMRTLAETAVEQGCDETFIRHMLADALRATARLIAEGGREPEEVLGMLATHRGLTSSALHTIEARGVFAGIRAGARAMTGRSYELRGEPVPDEHMGFLR
jgi:pyrroline-5-carboxylate reductase